MKYAKKRKNVCLCKQLITSCDQFIVVYLLKSLFGLSLSLGNLTLLLKYQQQHTVRVTISVIDIRKQLVR